MSHTLGFVALLQSISHDGTCPGVSVKGGDYCFFGTISPLFPSQLCRVI